MIENLKLTAPDNEIMEGTFKSKFLRMRTAMNFPCIWKIPH